MNSARGSCRLRSWAAPILGTGDAGWHPGGGLSDWLPRRVEPEKLSEGGTIYAGLLLTETGLSDLAFIGGDSLPVRASLPVADMR
jgi:hypothetical protein